MKTQILSLISLLILALFACKNEVKPLNPNGDSELAILMREMHQNGMDIKNDINNGKLPVISVDYSKIKTAKETKGMKPTGVPFEAFADMYIHSMKKLEKCDNLVDAKKHFTSMQKNCLSCHQQMCPGPIVLINKLSID